MSSSSPSAVPQLLSLATALPGNVIEQARASELGRAFFGQRLAGSEPAGAPDSRTVALVCGAAAAGLFVASLERIPGARDLVGLPRAAGVLGGIGVYVAFVWWTARRDPGALRAAALPTVVAGVAFVANICVENFARVPRALDPWVTLAFMLAIFASFGAAGYRGYRRSVRASTGLMAAFSAAAIGVLIALDCGFLLNVVAAPRLAQDLGVEAAQHHLVPTVAFTVLNSSESALEHLIEAPVIALIVGLLGVGLARFTFALIKMIQVFRHATSH